ncbi:LexA family protein [Methylobacterium oryzihabitans]|uniref:HTH cro/C1-type domain-containing protein n=1 Tax=Methylobacterium oryzihabitans TaxID=2499852 RepID=A0A437NY48_9HYPH|nr:S24 family peptidase [Methylobacterium oryzihabitans]RVU14936.1 hypothetical protein EOE48_21170 [Methylobacterium oryzihabitans]
MTREEIEDWLRNGLETSGFSMAEASRQLGIPRDAISKVLKQERELSALELARLATILGIAPPQSLINAMQPAFYITVVGEAQAGLWRDMSQDYFAGYSIPAMIEPPYKPQDLFAILIGGPSINLRAKDGDHVIVLKYEAAPRGIRDGDWVVVERTKGELRELTIRVVKSNKSGGLDFHFCSDDSRYDAFISQNLAPGETVKVLGFAMNFVSRGTMI